MTTSDTTTIFNKSKSFFLVISRSIDYAPDFGGAAGGMAVAHSQAAFPHPTAILLPVLASPNELGVDFINCTGGLQQRYLSDWHREPGAGGIGERALRS
jgi:hypothetical protein